MNLNDSMLLSSLMCFHSSRRTLVMKSVRLFHRFNALTVVCTELLYFSGETFLIFTNNLRRTQVPKFISSFTRNNVAN